MSIQDAAMTIPTYEIDKIVTTIDTSVTVTDFVGQQSEFVTIDGLTDNNYTFVGIYSYDNGAVWHDIAYYVASSGITITPTVAVRGHLNNGLWNLTIIQSALINGGSDWTLLLKGAFIVLPEQTELDTTDLNPGDTLYSSALSYMKIASQGSFTRTASSAETRTIAHNLGHVPNVAVDLKDSLLGYRPFGENYGLSGSVIEGVRIDATNIYISTPAFSPVQDITVQYKIYYEN